MCMLNDTQCGAVAGVVAEFLKKGKPFTGQEVHRACNTAMPGREVSSYVRELFNSGDMPGWASIQVVPKVGPVLYFKPSRTSAAAKAVTRIKEAMSGAQEEVKALRS